MDPTNADTNLLRNAIRLEGIPALERATGREIRAPLARVADEMRSIALERLPESRSPLPAKGSVRFRRGDRIDLSVMLLEERSSTDAFRVVRAWLKEVRLPVSREAIEAILDLANGRAGRRRDLPGGLKAVREKEYVRVSRSSPES